MNAEPDRPNSPQSKGSTTLHVRESRLTGYLQGLDLRKELLDLLERGYSEIVLDLTDVELISSSIIGTLIGVSREFWSRSTSLVLTNLHPQVKEILSATRVDELFKIRDD